MNKYHMRRQDRQINDSSELNEILSNGKYAVISMCKENQPYIVTLSYGYDNLNNALYFHTGLNGQKIDFLKHNPKVCATVIDDRGYIEKECGHEYRSIVLYGKMSFVESIDEKMNGMNIILNHLEEIPDIIKERSLKNEKVYNNIEILKLNIEEMSGKKGR